MDSFVSFIYRSWYTAIVGVQARYYLPFIFMIYLCLQNDKIECKMKVENYQTAVMMAAGGFALWQVFLNFIYVRVYNMIGDKNG